MAKDKEQNESGKLYVVSGVRLSVKDLKEVYGSSGTVKPYIRAAKKAKKVVRKKADPDFFDFSLLATTK